MDPSPFKLELETHKRDIIADRMNDIRDLDLELIKLESDLRELQTEDAEDSAIIKELQEVVAEFAKPVAGRSPELQRMLQANPDTQRSRVELAKAKGRNALNAQHQSEVNELLTRTRTARDTFAKEATIIADLDLATAEVAKAGVLRDDEYQEYLEIATKIEQCQLKTPHGGTVDRLDKEIGEFVQVGEGVLKIVGDPEEVICFLPQDQAHDLKIGKPVWVANTANKADIYESVVIGVSPRINNVIDVSSPIPNQRAHGRDVVVQYPPGARPKGPEDVFKLLPGQTLIIHLEKPGDVPWLDRLFKDESVQTSR
jgi:multidrug resistance efflux pump